MSVAELIEEIKTLPENRVAEVRDFVEFIKHKEAENATAGQSDTSCPICAKHRDPVTGELRFNAETIAAFEEGDAMLRGDIPAKWYTSFDEMMADLDSDDND
jgi:hypothetical protein